MRISPIQKSFNFKGATININALSDTHGHLELADCAYQTLMENDAFERDEKGKANFLIIGGDWFISGDKKGFQSNPARPLAKFQEIIFNKFIGNIKKTFPNLETIFCLGNHDDDGGNKMLLENIKNIDAQTIVSNLDIQNPGDFEEIVREGKLTDSKISFVPDDKKPGFAHAVLNLDVCPVNFAYYQKESKNLGLVDNVKVAQKFVKPEDYEKTMQKVIAQIDDFKEKYPQGTVITTLHTGVDFAQNLAEQRKVDLIFNAHEHKRGIEYINGVPIVQLSQNFLDVINAKITKDDDGKTSKIKINVMHPDDKKFPPGEIEELRKAIFKEDLKKKYRINKKGFDVFFEIANVRSSGSHLANLITDAILDEIKQKDNSVQIFALNASSIRGGFKLDEKNGKNVSFFELSNCLDGLSPEQAEIYVNEVSGEKLAYMILDNLLFNQIDTEKNPIIHYSGLIIDKKGMLNAHENQAGLKELCKFIILEETGKSIDPEENYKIANVEKYFIKSKNEKIRDLKQNARPIGLNARNAFENHFKKNIEVSYEAKTRFY